MSGSVLKAWNPISSQWEVVLVGKQGPQGDDGIEVSATPPLNTTILWADTSEPGDMVVPVGGSTGQALVKVSGSDYDTTWASTLSPTIIDAKGDLIVGTAADTASRLAVGTANNQVLTVDSSTGSGLKWNPQGNPTVRTSTAYAIPGSIWVASGGTASWDPARLWLASFFVPRTPITVTGLQCRYTVAGSAGSVVVMGVFEIPAQFSGSCTPVVTGSVAADAAAGIKSATGLSTQLTAGKLYGLGLTHNSTANMTFVYRGHAANYGDPRVDINDMINRLITSAGGYTTTQLTNLTAVTPSTTSTASPGDFSLVMMSWTD